MCVVIHNALAGTVFGDHSWSVGLCMRDYKSIRVSVMICAISLYASISLHIETQTAFDQIFNTAFPTC